MKTAQIRSEFLRYFESKGHTLVESSSLVPSNDPTLLFTNAGMVQFKDVFLGKDQRSYKRATTSQKCVRAGGKHNDLENVGFTARHHTFFEMLGNFSFGDYFKKEAIHYAWEFVTQVLKLPKDRVYVSVFEKDDEAAKIWHEQEKVPLDRIFRFGEKDNFWSMGETGPCGPCSELYIDRGEKYGCGKKTCTVGCDCDRYMEFWNLVFMQYDRSADGKLTPLPKPSVDTGAGLERLAAILQDAPTNYDTDLFKTIIEKTAALLGRTYSPSDTDAVSYRVIADHARATAFLISDGVLPSNEGRGYVLRRIMRRAIRHGKKLGFDRPFFHEAAQFVIDQMKDAYPSLVTQHALIDKAIRAEEEQFLRTLERGLVLLDEEAERAQKTKTLPGDVVFRLYDTFGFPLDLTRTIATEKGLRVDEAGFEAAMAKQRSDSRKNWKGSGQESIGAEFLKLETELRQKNQLPQFIGYDSLESEGKCLAALPVADGPKDEVLAVFSPTPFYGESGGQTGDHGRVAGSGFEGLVLDVTKPTPDLIVARLKVRSGELKIGASYTQTVDSERRALTMRNHTATHLLQWALREVLGTHVKQAGSLVTPELLRFDFTHFQALTDEEIVAVENLINQKIWSGDFVTKETMNRDDAVSRGAIAMFGEKYGEVVRVVSVGGYSTELCGGTHVDRSSDIHLFKVGSESGIASGTRRIIAYTSKGAFEALRQGDQRLKEVRTYLKASANDEILPKLERLNSAEREIRKQLEAIQSRLAAGEVDGLLAKSIDQGGIRWVLGACEPDSGGMKRLREMVDQIKQKIPASVIVLGMKDPDGSKVSLVAAHGPSVKGIDAGALIREIAPLIDGKGGGKPDFAQAGGTKTDGLTDALTRAQEWLTKQSQRV